MKGFDMLPSRDDLDNLDLARFRKEHFAIEVKRARYSKDGTTLLITGNGSQWSGITLESRQEVRQVIKALQNYLRETE